MVNVSKLKPAHQQQYAIMLLHHYHELCNTNDPSSMFVPNIESLSQSTISSLDSGLFGKNIAGVNIQQQTTLEVNNKKRLMADNEDLDPPPPQNILNVFSAAEF